MRTLVILCCQRVRIQRTSELMIVYVALLRIFNFTTISSKAALDLRTMDPGVIFHLLPGLEFLVTPFKFTGQGPVLLLYMPTFMTLQRRLQL